MSPSSVFSTFRRSRIYGLLAVLLIGSVIGPVACQHFVREPQRQAVVRRYEEFRAVVAAGDAGRILAFVAPEFRPWANDRLHLYGTFAGPLTERSRVSVSSDEATICPRPQTHYYVFLGGDVVKMVKHEGEWFMGRVYID